ncbi:MAG TPA: hypothetical protein VGN57_06125 [Pirellulaceae bacterium]|jgi:hypothetical protein|nr:hypothetical protein [Pirellulaceae bacterium]
MSFFSIGTLELPPPHESWLLYERQPPGDGPPELRPAYRGLQCRKCRRVDELQALQSGIHPEFRPPLSGVEAQTTDDGFLVVTRRVVEALLAIPSLDVRRFPVPASPDHFVLVPKRQFHPPLDARLYTPIEPPDPGDAFQVRGRRCARCQRHRTTTFWLERFEIPADVVLAGAMVEIGFPGVSVCWIASQAVADALRGFSGFDIKPADARLRLRRRP